MCISLRYGYFFEFVEELEIVPGLLGDHVKSGSLHFHYLA